MDPIFELTMSDSVYRPRLSKRRFFTLENAKIATSLTLSFDYFTSSAYSDVLFVSQLNTKQGERVFKVSQVV